LTCTVYSLPVLVVVPAEDPGVVNTARRHTAPARRYMPFGSSAPYSHTLVLPVKSKPGSAPCTS